MNYAVGHNMQGYLPESDVHIYSTFDEAKATLIHNLKFNEDYAEDEWEAETFSAAAEDVNLWSGQDSLIIGYVAYWINETDMEVDSDEPWVNSVYEE